MAFYGAPTQFASYPTAYGFPQQFGAPVQQRDAASAHEGSQAGEAQSHSVSGFAQPQAFDAGFGGFYGAPIQGATYIGGAAPQFYGAQPTVIPGATVLPAAYGPATTTFLPGSALVPVAAPQIRRPGYNERLVAWRNRQKAFNRYKRETKQAIKHANQTHYHQQNTVLAQSTVLAPAAYGAAPIYGATHFGAPAFAQSTFLPAYGQQTFIGGFPSYPVAFPAGAVYAGEQQEQQEGQYGDFTSYSSNNAAQEVQQEEPEIRGTQV